MVRIVSMAPMATAAAVLLAVVAPVCRADVGTVITITSVGDAAEDPTVGLPNLASEIDLGDGEFEPSDVASVEVDVLQAINETSLPAIFDAKLTNDNFWYGELRYDAAIHPDPPGSMGSLNIYRNPSTGAVAGSLLHGGNIYHIETDLELTSSISRISDGDFSGDGEPLLPLGDDGTGDGSDIYGDGRTLLEMAENPGPIDVLVAYTLRSLCQQARLEYPCEDTPANRGPVEDRIALAIEETNAMYEMSGVRGRLRLAGTHLDADYDELGEGVEGDFNVILKHLQNTTDGMLDGVHDARAAAGADVVQLWVREGNYCGLAYTGQRVMDAEFAFGVVKLGCSTGRFTFSHELGHVQGCTHDGGARIDLDDGVRDPAAWIVKPHGYVAPEFAFRTNLAYDLDCEDPFCPKIQRFSTSDPDVTWYGQGIGTEVNDCVWQINRSFRHIASFLPESIEDGEAPPETTEDTDPDAAKNASSAANRVLAGPFAAGIVAFVAIF